MSAARKNQQTAIVKRPPVLDFRKLPTTVTGAPQALFADWAVVMTISSSKTITHELVEKNPANPLKRVTLPIEELLKLNRAAGFVRGSEKDVSKTELLDTARAFFFNAKENPDKVKEPKLLAQTAKTLCENLEKTVAAIETAGDEKLDQCAKHLLQELVPRANAYIEEVVGSRLRGEPPEDDALLLAKGITKSLKAKLLTGHIVVPGAAKLGPVLFGKELSNFGRITLKEVLLMKDYAKTYIRQDWIDKIRALATPDYVGRLIGDPPGAPVNQKALDKILNFSFPFQPLLDRASVLERMEATRERAMRLSEDQHPYPGLAKIFNAMVEEIYCAPPAVASEVRAFWEKAAGTGLEDPTVSSLGYRAQTIAVLRTSLRVEVPPLPQKETVKNVLLLGVPYASLYRINTAAVVGGVAMQVRSNFESYNPRSLALPQTAKKKKNPPALIRALTTVSLGYLRQLARAGIGKEMRQDISDYLQSFMDVRFQEMAAEIVYITLQHSAEGAAKELFLREDEEFEDEPVAVARNEVDDDDDE